MSALSALCVLFFWCRTVSALNNVITLSLLHPIDKTPVQSWTFEEEPVVRIGRSVNNDVVLYSAVVSRHHAELRQGENGWEIHNIGSNGTYLAGQRIESKPVQDGLVIRLARSGPNIQINIIQQTKGMSSIHALMEKQKHPAK
ncbi:MAG: FHA domain-containing protein [Phormidesmis sp. RL_2_1]|nr:FHA domain-containing protein [Phormidesmis sp. RL_2_1]